jgi:ferredoxin
MKTLKALKITSIIQIIYCAYCLLSTLLIIIGINIGPIVLANTMLYIFYATVEFSIFIMPMCFIANLVTFLKERKSPEQINVIGDFDFRPDRPILLSELSSAKTAGGKVTARIRTLIEKAEACVFMSYPKMNEKCILCGKCVLSCPKSALKIENKKIILDKSKCIGCLCCDEMCPNGAVDIGKKIKRR